ncbi:MAG: hypothetical protein K2X76_07120, partial [Sphingomonas sp.]|nr:hypothetical protein [Sphingomonas sp.]
MARVLVRAEARRRKWEARRGDIEAHRDHDDPRRPGLEPGLGCLSTAEEEAKPRLEAGATVWFDHETLYSRLPEKDRR